MKKLLPIIMIFAMLFSLTACSGGEDNSDPNLIKIGDYQAVYKGSEITKNDDGEDALVATFDFTNNSQEAQSFIWAMYHELTQDGTELEYTTIFVDEDSYDALDDSINENVEPGESLEVKLTYKLNDLTTPVEVKFSDFYETETDNLTIDLTELK